MPLVLRWGRSAYETDEALEMERRGAEELGLDWDIHPHRSLPPRLPEAEVLVVTSTVRVSAAAQEDFTGSLVLTTTSGFDHLDLEAARRHGVPVLRLPQARRDAVVDHALASLLHFARRIPEQREHARQGHWSRGDLPEMAQLGLHGMPVLVVGLGVIGARMSEVLRALGAEVLGVDPRGVPDGIEAVDLDGGLKRCRALTLHCDLNPTSRGMLSRARLEALSAGCLVVNTARGPILDVDAAVELAESGHLGGLSVDVFPTEPWPNLVDHQRILMTAHAAGYTEDLGVKVATGVIDALRAWVTDDELPYRVA